MTCDALIRHIPLGFKLGYEKLRLKDSGILKVFVFFHKSLVSQCSYKGESYKVADDGEKIHVVKTHLHLWSFINTNHDTDFSLIQDSVGIGGKLLFEINVFPGLTVFDHLINITYLFNIQRFRLIRQKLSWTCHQSSVSLEFIQGINCYSVVVQDIFQSFNAVHKDLLRYWTVQTVNCFEYLSETVLITEYLTFILFLVVYNGHINIIQEGVFVVKGNCLILRKFQFLILCTYKIARNGSGHQINGEGKPVVHIVKKHLDRDPYLRIRVYQWKTHQKSRKHSRYHSVGNTQYDNKE